MNLRARPILLAMQTINCLTVCTALILAAAQRDWTWFLTAIAGAWSFDVIRGAL
jgi:hypothetical protein